MPVWVDESGHQSTTLKIVLLRIRGHACAQISLGTYCLNSASFGQNSLW